MIHKKLLLLLLVTAPSFAQYPTEPFKSVKLGATRDITIITPESYESGKKDKKYPLLLLLDGDYLVDPFSGLFSYTSYWDDLPEVIIVGINQNENNERANDTGFDKDTGFPAEEGAQFYDFIATELLPYIEKNYRVAPFKIIAGHDATAGFINAFLFKDKPLFNAYISLSPELPEIMETRIAERLGSIKEPLYYYLATADGDTGKFRKRITAVDTSIKTITNPGLRYRFDDFKNATHYSLTAYGIPAAIYHIFADFQPISSLEYQTKIANLPSGYVKYLEDKYEKMDEELGMKIPVRINDLQAIEAAIIKNGLYDELRDLSDLAKKNYPKTILSEYYTALYYEKTGDNKRAKKAYVNCYALKEIGEYTKEYMLERSESLK